MTESRTSHLPPDASARLAATGVDESTLPRSVPVVKREDRRSDAESEDIGSCSDTSVAERVNMNSDCIKEEKEAILAWVQAIGSMDAYGRFVPKPGCMEPLQQIWRLLSETSPKGRARLHLGNYATMQNTLIPLFVCEYINQDLFIVILTIMTLMMKPVEYGCWLSFNQVHFLQVYKQALVTSNVFAIIMYKMRDIIAKDTSERTPEERSLLLTTILFFKRVLAVPDDKPSTKSANNIFENLQDRCILQFKKDNVLDCIRYLAVTELSRPCYVDKIDPDKNLLLVLLSCIFYIVHRESSESLLDPDDQTGAAVQQLLEIERNRSSALSKRASRHSRFGGVVKVAAVGGTRFASTLEKSKSSYEHPKTLLVRNRRIYFSDDVRKTLLDFANEFYSSAFNAFTFKLFEDKWLQMSIHDEIMPKEMRAVVPQFYHMTSFFLAFNRGIQKRSAECSSTFSLDKVAVCFEFDYLDDACKFLSRAATNIDWEMIESSVRFYKELLRNICEYSDKGDKQLASELILQINYNQECRFSLPALLKRYNVKNCAKRLLELLVETSYFQLKVLDRSSNVICDRKPKRRRKRNPVDDEEDSDSDDDFEFDREVEVTSWLQKCLHPQIVSNVMQVIKDYKINDDSLNKFAITLLHKITFRQSYTPMLFRVPFLIVFHDILGDRSIRRNPGFQPLRDFSKFVVREFFKLSRDHKSLVIDALFPITRRICEEISDSCHARRLAAAAVDLDTFPSKESSGDQKAAAVEGETSPSNDSSDGDSEAAAAEAEPLPSNGSCGEDHGAALEGETSPANETGAGDIRAAALEGETSPPNDSSDEDNGAAAVEAETFPSNESSTGDIRAAALEGESSPPNEGNGGDNGAATVEAETFPSNESCGGGNGAAALGGETSLPNETGAGDITVALEGETLLSNESNDGSKGGVAVKGETSPTDESSGGGKEAPSQRRSKSV